MPNGLKRNGSTYISPPPNGWGLRRPQRHTQYDTCDLSPKIPANAGLTHRIRVSPRTYLLVKKLSNSHSSEIGEIADAILSADNVGMC